MILRDQDKSEHRQDLPSDGKIRINTGTSKTMTSKRETKRTRKSATKQNKITDTVFEDRIQIYKQNSQD